MGKISVLTMITTLCLIGHSFSLPTMDEMNTTNAGKEYTRDLLDWLMSQQTNENPCDSKESVRSIIRYLRSALSSGYWSPNQVQAKKRNSELINSLLSIPKTMNDAGK